METHQNIKYLREKQGLSQEALAIEVGYSDRSSIAKIEAGKVDLPQSKIAAFAKALNVSPAQLMGIEGNPTDVRTIPSGFQKNPDLSRVPRIGRIACGEPITAEENIEGYDEVPTQWRSDFTLTCCGDSMLPKIQDGDVVAIRKQDEVRNGEVAAVRIGDEATLKYVYRHADYIELRPANPAYESIIRRKNDMNDVRIEGKAVGLFREL